MAGEQRLGSPASASSGLWSSFHSTLAQAARGPGTPLRQQQLLSPEPAERGEGRSAAGGDLMEEFRTQLTELDLLME